MFPTGARDFVSCLFAAITDLNRAEASATYRVVAVTSPLAALTVLAPG